jgi:3-oxoacyl-[acyl-carrier protein] reductase
MKTMRLKDKVAIVTGAGHGIGKATAIAFAREGAHVAVVDINMAGAEATVAEINNAGITRDARLVKMTEQQWDAVINVNLKGVWLCARAVAPHMSAQGSGSIINVSSIVGLYGNFGQSNYAATKGGVIAMTKTWARELGASGCAGQCGHAGIHRYRDDYDHPGEGDPDGLRTHAAAPPR